MTRKRAIQIRRRLAQAYAADERHGKPDWSGVVYETPRMDKVIQKLGGEFREYQNYMDEHGWNSLPNPGKGSFARCVSAVSRRGGVDDPNAVCAASKRRTKKGARELEAASRKARKPKRNKPTPHGALYKSYPITLNDYGYYIVPKIDRDSWFDTIPEAKKHIDWWLGRKRNKAKRNPADAASEAYAGFHGRPPDELVKIEETVHFHRHLAGAGELRKIEVHGRYTVTLSNFKGALLAFNEKRTQLFIKGGDQAVDLKQFGIKTTHEIETLGEVRAIEYFTTKDHLGSDGGTAVYVHRFHKPYPILIYRTIDKKLEFSGGSYDVPDEGIDK
jgi:hypothetical protein